MDQVVLVFWDIVPTKYVYLSTSNLQQEKVYFNLLFTVYFDQVVLFFLTCLAIPFVEFACLT